MADPSLIERLRAFTIREVGNPHPLLEQAASTLEDQARLIGECREVLATHPEYHADTSFAAIWKWLARKDALLTKLKASVDGATK